MANASCKYLEAPVRTVGTLLEHWMCCVTIDTPKHHSKGVNQRSNDITHASNNKDPRMYLYWTLCTSYSLAYQVRVTAGKSGLCCYLNVWCLLSTHFLPYLLILCRCSGPPPVSDRDQSFHSFHVDPPNTKDHPFSNSRPSVKILECSSKTRAALLSRWSENGFQRTRKSNHMLGNG